MLIRRMARILLDEEEEKEIDWLSSNKSQVKSLLDYVFQK